jgi:hypothetical protein
MLNVVPQAAQARDAGSSRSPPFFPVTTSSP